MAKETFTTQGRVLTVNDKGIKLEGNEEWFNFSQYSPVPPDAIPNRGDTVTVTHDNRQFISHIAKGNGAAPRPAAPAPARPAQRSIPASGQMPDNIGEDDGFDAPARRYDDRDYFISRQVALKAGIEFAAPNQDATKEDVVKFAQFFHEWLLKG